MKNIHIVIPDLFLPQQLANYACGDVLLPALEKLLARADDSPLNTDTLESWLCRHFAVEGMAIAPLTLHADGLQAGAAYWLRADPVGISMQRDQMVLQSGLNLSRAEADLLCASLNAHFASDGLQFAAPHPQRWYVQLENTPAMETYPLGQVVGADMHAHLPFGEDALRWHGLLNEVQMLFHEHAVNQAREQRGEAVVNGIWLWGGGKYPAHVAYSAAMLGGDSECAQAFAKAAGMAVLPASAALPESWSNAGEDLLIVWEGLRHALHNADIGRWRAALMQFEQDYAAPVLAALGEGRISKVTLDVLNENASRRFEVNRASLWKIWRQRKPLVRYALK